MLLDRPQIDWLTLTTFGQGTFLQWRRWLHRQRGETDGEYIRKMQYKGIQAGGVFLGEGKQRKRAHYMLQASGEAAHRCAEALGKEPGPQRPTRVDVQITSRIGAVDWRDFEDTMRAWEIGGRARNVRLISDSSGRTLYIGSRQSDLLIRFYEKATTDGEVAVRCELEYKGDKAVEAWRIWRLAGQEGLEGLLNTELSHLPVHSVIARFQELLNVWSTRPATKVTEDTDTLRWLRHAVDPTIERLLQDHDAGPYVRRMVRAWAQLADDLDAT